MPELAESKVRLIELVDVFGTPGEEGVESWADDEGVESIES